MDEHFCYASAWFLSLNAALTSFFACTRHTWTHQNSAPHRYLVELQIQFGSVFEGKQLGGSSFLPVLFGMTVGSILFPLPKSHFRGNLWSTSTALSTSFLLLMANSYQPLYCPFSYSTLPGTDYFSTPHHRQLSHTKHLPSIVPYPHSCPEVTSRIWVDCRFKADFQDQIFKYAQYPSAPIVVNGRCWIQGTFETLPLPGSCSGGDLAPGH